MTTAFEPENSAPADYAQTLDGFPLPEMTSAIADFQSILALLEYEGKLYSPGATPADRHNRWLQCDATARWLAEKCLKNQDG